MEILDILFKHFTLVLKPEIVFRSRVIPANAQQRFVLIHQYYAVLTSSFTALPNTGRYQVLSVDNSEMKARQLAYFVDSKISEKYNFDLDSNGDVSESGKYHIASIKSIQQPIFTGLVSGGGYQYSQNFEVRF